MEEKTAVKKSYKKNASQKGMRFLSGKNRCDRL